MQPIKSALSLMGQLLQAKISLGHRAEEFGDMESSTCSKIGVASSFKEQAVVVKVGAW